MEYTLFRSPEKQYVKESKKTLRRLAVLGNTPGAGASFVSGLLAWMLARQGCPPRLMEVEDGYFYQALGMEKRFIQRPFSSLPQLLQQKDSLRHVPCVEEGICWLLRKPDETYTLTDAELFRSINNAEEEALILDCSGVPKDRLLQLLPECECKLLVVDPKPSCLLKNAPFLERLRFAFPNLTLIINKMNRGVPKGEIERFLGTKDLLYIPELPLEHLYRSEFNCSLPAENEELQKLLAPFMKELLSCIQGPKML